MGIKYTPSIIIVPIGPSTAYIQLQNGLFSCIDVDSIDTVKPFRWTANLAPHTGRYYVEAKTQGPRRKKIAIHRLIMGFPKTTVDHKSLESLDNRIANLRIANMREQSYNRGLRSDSASGYKGVSRNPRNGKPWIATIRDDKTQRYLGCFWCPREAHEAWKKAAIQLHGEFFRES